MQPVEQGRNEAERWFERYLREHGYDYEYEPDLGVQTRPDFLVRRDGIEIVCEVKGFEQIPALERRMTRADEMRVVMASADEVYGPLRNAVREAARQLRPLAASPWPLVVVLANPRGHHLNLDGEHLLAAMYGNPGFAGQFNRGEGRVENFTFQLGRDGRLRNDHLYISAVAALQERDRAREAFEMWRDEWKKTRPPLSDPPTHDEIVAEVEATHAAWAASDEAANAPEGKAYSLELITTGSPEAVPLLDTILNGPRDQRALVERVPVQ